MPAATSASPRSFSARSSGCGRSAKATDSGGKSSLVRSSRGRRGPPAAPDDLFKCRVCSDSDEGDEHPEKSPEGSATRRGPCDSKSNHCYSEQLYSMKSHWIHLRRKPRSALPLKRLAGPALTRIPRWLDAPNPTAPARPRNAGLRLSRRRQVHGGRRAGGGHRGE